MPTNKKVIYISLAVLVAILGFITILKLPNLVRTDNWATYENEKFGFRIKHPADWIVFADPDNNLMPAFNIYPQSVGAIDDLPLIHHSRTPNVSIFPNGVPTEGIFSATQPSKVNFKEPPIVATDFLLENGDVWATFAGYQYGSPNWLGGFLWARTEIDNYSSVCFGGGVEKPMNQCDLMTGNDTLIHRGSTNKQMRAIQEKILESFEFTVETITDLIRVDYPKFNDVIKSPLVIRGEARGDWFSEAAFPITLTDWDGKIIVEGYATAQGEPTTTEFVPFESRLEFKNPSRTEPFTKQGYLILRRGNDSNQSSYNQSIEIPVRFE